MVEHLLDYFLTQPRRLVGLGRSLVNVGGFLVVAGAIAHAATASVSVVRGIAGGVQPNVMLVNLMPGMPTWWIPEGVFGFGLAALVVLAGVAALRTGRVYERLLRH